MHARAPLASLHRQLQAWHDDQSLRVPQEWRRRGDVLDRLEASVFQAEAALAGPSEALRGELADIQRAFCAGLREAIRRGDGADTLSALAIAYDGDASGGDDYDTLDALIAEVLAPDVPPAEAGALLPDMVFYQPTPARHLFALLRRLDLRADDVLVDLGSGLGHLPLLAAILTPAACLGVELESSYIAYARRSAESLGLRQARFTAADACTIDLETGTVFYLYSPFTGAMLADMLRRLEWRARARPLRVATLGPCTAEVAKMPWLRTGDVLRGDLPVVFHSC